MPSLFVLLLISYFQVMIVSGMFFPNRSERCKMQDVKLYSTNILTDLSEPYFVESVLVLSDTHQQGF